MSDEGVAQVAAQETPSFGAQIKSAREAKGWSLNKLGKMFGTTGTAIKRIEDGLTKHSHYLPLVQQALGLPVSPPQFRTSKHSRRRQPRRSRRPRHVVSVDPKPRRPRAPGPTVKINWENMEPVEIIEHVSAAMTALCYKMMERM